MKKLIFYTVSLIFSFLLLAVIFSFRSANTKSANTKNNQVVATTRAAIATATQPASNEAVAEEPS